MTPADVVVTSWMLPIPNLEGKEGSGESCNGKEMQWPGRDTYHICLTLSSELVKCLYPTITGPRIPIQWTWSQFLHSILQFNSVQFSSVAQSCPTLCDPMNCSTPGLPVHHQLPEFTQTHVHRVSDAIQPSHPLSSPSPPAPSPSQHQSLLQWVNSSHEVAKVLEFQLQHRSLRRTPRTDLLQNGLVGSPCSPRDSQESSPTPQFKSTNSLALSFLHSPTLASIRDHWKNHSLD